MMGPPRVRRLLVLAAVATLAVAAYRVRIQRDLVDFQVYRTAAVRAAHGDPLYRPEDGHFQFKYLPAFALAMFPFGRADEAVARAAWYAMSVTLLVLFVRHAIHALPDRRVGIQPLTWWTVLVTAKFWIKEIALGQTNLLLGVLLLATYFALQGRRAPLAGVLIALAVVVKPYALLFVPWVVWTGGAGCVAPMAITLGAALVLPAAVYGWHGNLEQLAGWYGTVTDTTAPNLLYPENISFATMWAKWIGAGRAAALLAIATAGTALGAAVWVVRRGAHVDGARYLELGLLALLVPLLSPQGWDYVLLLALPAFVCVIDRLRELTASWRTAVIAAMAATSFTVFDLLGRAAYTQLMAVSVVTVGAGVLVASLAELRRRALA
jgi:hypothetical protein